MIAKLVTSLAGVWIEIQHLSGLNPKGFGVTPLAGHICNCYQRNEWSTGISMARALFVSLKSDYKYSKPLELWKNNVQVSKILILLAFLFEVWLSMYYILISEMLLYRQNYPARSKPWQSTSPRRTVISTLSRGRPGMTLPKSITWLYQAELSWKFQKGRKLW